MKNSIIYKSPRLEKKKLIKHHEENNGDPAWRSDSL